MHHRISQRTLHLGGDEDFHAERRKHLKVFSFHNIPQDKQRPISNVDFTALRRGYGTILIRVIYPANGKEKKRKGETGAMTYFHKVGYIVDSVDDFENGLRLLLRGLVYRYTSNTSVIMTYHAI